MNQREAERGFREDRRRGIGDSSVLRSKIIASIYDVLTKVGIKLDINDICKKCSIRKNTIMRFVSELKLYKSHFIDIYIKYEIES